MRNNGDKGEKGKSNWRAKTKNEDISKRLHCLAIIVNAAEN